jgi:RimJ/RimL family protein N-acetyltransferase
LKGPGGKHDPHIWKRGPETFRPLFLFGLTIMLAEHTPQILQPPSLNAVSVPFPILITPRLTLRPPLPLDAEDIAEWLADDDVRRFLPRLPSPYGLEDAEAWLAKPVGPYDRIFTLHRERLIGVIGFIGERASPQLGFWLGKPFHRQGLMHEALTVALSYIFEDPEVVQIKSGVLIGNDASLGLQRKLGFVETGEATHETPRGIVPVITTLLRRGDLRS